VFGQHTLRHAPEGPAQYRSNVIARGAWSSRPPPHRRQPLQDEPAFPLGPGARALTDALLVGTGDGVGVFDAAGRLVDCNAAFCQFWRLPSRDACLEAGTAWTAHIEVLSPAGDAVAHGDWVVARALRGDGEVDGRYVLRHPATGDEWDGRVSTAPLRASDGAVAGGIISTRDSSEERRLLEELRASQVVLRGLIAERERLQDEERKRISRELHDGLQQVLTALNMKLGMAAEAIPRNPEAAVRWLDDAQDSVIDTSQAIRDMIKALRPQGLADRGLRDALEGLARTQAGVGRITCEFTARGMDGTEPPPDVGDCLFRVAQEALTNVIKHAAASRAHVTLEGDPHGALTLRIADNGRGISDTPPGRGSLGLIGMRERVRAIGGTLRVTGAPDAGTTVEVVVPSPSTRGEPQP
jgi:signal transduction histidine kinase